MIIALVGVPGAGKSYEAVYEVLNNLRLGRRVYTNIEGMETPDCQRFMQDYLGFDDYQFKSTFFWLSDQDIKHFWDLTEKKEIGEGVCTEEPLVKPGSLLVLDEIHKLFSNRDWNSQSNKLFADWCSTHRHYGFDVYFVTQDMNKVEKHVRSVIQWTYVFRKVDFLGGLQKNRYIKYCYSGDDTNCKELNIVSRTYHLPVFKCYKSMVNDQNLKYNIMPKVNILKHPVFFAIPALLCLFLYLFFTKSSFATGDIFGTSKMVKNHNKKPVQASLSSSRPPAPHIASLARPVPPSVVDVPFVNHSSSYNRKYVSDREIKVTVKAIIKDVNKYFYLLSDGRSVTSEVRYSLNSVFQEVPL